MVKTIKNLYQEIWGKGKHKNYIVTKTRTPYECEEVSFSGLAHFVPIKGCKYDCSKNRLMVIGRAVNGWYSGQAKSTEEYGEYVEKTLNDTGFKWVINKNGTLYNIEETYKLSSPFWNSIKAVLDRILDSDCDEKWVEHIVWTNLYKVAPTYMDNPDSKMKKIQQEECLEILKNEIELYKPTHILAITGWYEWLEDFADMFENIKIYGKNIASGKNKNDIYVEATAEYNSIPVVVVCRPEMRNKEEYQKQLLEYFVK